MNLETSFANRRVGILTVTADDPVSAGKRKKYRAICDCGSEAWLTSYEITKERRKSCGCIRARHLVKLNTKHGRFGTTEYIIWRGVIERCRKPDHHAYPRYGGRGITVCDEWLSFEKFLADMGERPNRLVTLDRIDNNKGYSKENCRWATAHEQAWNSKMYRHGTGKMGVNQLRDLVADLRFTVETLESKNTRLLDALERAMSYLDEYAKHAADSGWHYLAQELRRRHSDIRKLLEQGDG